MTKLYDLCVATHRYTDKEGNEKNAYENIGAILEKEEGKPYMMLKAHFNPAGITRKEGSESILVSLFKPKSKQDNSNGNDIQDFGSSFSGGFDDPAPYQQDFNPQPFNPEEVPF